MDVVVLTAKTHLTIFHIGCSLWYVICISRKLLYVWHLKKNQLDAQFIFSIFRHTPLHVSGVSIAHHQEVHRKDTTIILAGLEPNQEKRQSSKKNNKYQLLYLYCVPPDDGL
jgi:hypothetical protein